MGGGEGQDETQGPRRLRASEMESNLGTNQKGGPELNSQPAGINGGEEIGSAPAAFPARKEEDAHEHLIKGGTFLPLAFLRGLTSLGSGFCLNLNTSPAIPL